MIRQNEIFFWLSQLKIIRFWHINKVYGYKIETIIDNYRPKYHIIWKDPTSLKELEETVHEIDSKSFLRISVEERMWFSVTIIAHINIFKQINIVFIVINDIGTTILLKINKIKSQLYYHSKGYGKHFNQRIFTI